jgi:hypothetical protein
MSAPFRVVRPETENVAHRRRRDEDIRSYLDRLIKMIPSEVISLYIIGSGLIPQEESVALLVWTVICLIGVICIRIYGTADPRRRLPPQWQSVSISSISFLIWVYSLGGVFKAFHLYVSYIGSLLILAWTFFIPLFYKGSFDS